MVGTLLSSLGGWWSRLWSRVSRAWPSGAVTPTAPPLHDGERPAAAPEAPTAPPDRGGRTTESHPASAPIPAGPADAERCLIEVLGVEALPAPAPAVPNRPPALARTQTLAALDGLKQIPALQSLAQGFLRTMSRTEVSLPDVIDSVEKDSALCVRILRMANSVLVSPERRIEDLDTAIQMLGIARVRKAAQALFTLRDANRVAEGFDWRHLWVHALGTAAIAEELEQQLRSIDDSQVHLAGLLHDVGKIVLSTIAPDAYRDILIGAWNETGRLEELERQRLGVDHREAGVVFAQHNALPPVVVEAIAHHDQPEAATSHRFEVAVVSIANYLSKAHGLGFSGARLDDQDGDFGDLPAWKVIEEECGFRPDVDRLEEEMRGFVAGLRQELRLLGDEA